VKRVGGTPMISKSDEQPPYRAQHVAVAFKFRCAKCGKRRTDAVVMGRGAVGVQPWRQEAG
jgi:hypothetical protein